MTDPSRSPEIVRLTELLDKNPESRLFVPLAEAYLQAEMTDEAISVLSKGIQHHPMFVAARVMLGKVFLGKGMMTEAKSEFQQVREIAPNNIPSLRGMAVIAQREGRDEDAVNFYEQVLQVDPTDKAAALALEAGKAENAAAGTGFENHHENQRDAGLEEKAADPDEAEDGGKLEDVVEAAEGDSIVASEAAKPGPGAELTENEPYMTHTMAALYMAQRHFQKAADIYEHLLNENPEDEASRLGLTQACEALQGDAASHEEMAHLSVEEKIERLQIWLELIQRKKKS